MKKIIFFIFILFISNIFNSCSDELITIVDEYNPPYDVKVIPGSDGTSISINFWSGILADDFVGFNLYVKPSTAGSSFTQPSDAISNSTTMYPTIIADTHTRNNFTYTFPTMNDGTTYNNGTLYYVAVTAYGTNELAEGGRIETRITASVPVIPREEGDGSGNSISVGNNTIIGTIDANAQTVTPSGNFGVQYFGPQTNFNAVVLITNNNFPTTPVPYAVGGLYIFSNTGQTTLAKVWITSSGNYHWAYRNNNNAPNQWNGI